MHRGKPKNKTRSGRKSTSPRVLLEAMADNPVLTTPRQEAEQTVQVSQDDQGPLVRATPDPSEMIDLFGAQIDMAATVSGASPITAVHADRGTMCQVYKIASNPYTVCFYLNHCYLYPYGNYPAIDLTGGCRTNHDVDFLLLGCGDIRNILFTIKTLSDEKSKPKNLHFYLNDFEEVILARNLVLLRILEIIDPDRDEDVEFLWSVWYDAAIQQESHSRLIHIIQDLLQNVPPIVEYMTEETEEEVKRVLKYWLIGNLTLEDVKVMRLEVLDARLIEAMTQGENLIPPLIYEENQISTWIEEVVNFVDTGSTYKKENLKGSDNFSANPTLLCPRVAGWRVHPCGTPFHSYNLYGLTEGQSLFHNCLSQLKTMVWAWKRLRARKGNKIMISLWLEHCLTLCNNISTADRKFDFIHTSNIADHVGLLNLLVSCSGLLSRSGLLTMESMRWTVTSNSIYDYLNDRIGVPSSYFPTVFGLRLAEDFEMGTSTPRSISNHIGSDNVSIRWLDAGKVAERIDINDSPEFLAVFRRLVQDCMPRDGLRSDFKTPSLLVHIVRKMKDNIVGGAKTLLDIIIKSQPGLRTKSGHVFYPHENCIRSIWLTFRDQLGCDWPGDQEEHGLVMLEIPAQPTRDVEFSRERVLTWKILRNSKDYVSIAQHVLSPNEPWFFVTTIAYDMAGRIKLLLPSDVWDSLGNSSLLALHEVTEDQLFVPIAIKEHPGVKTLGRLCIATKSVNEEEKSNHLKVTEYKDKYEIHMKWHESLGEFPYLTVERGLDPTELLINSKCMSSTCTLRCPVLDVQTIPSLSDKSWKITAKKDLSALNGPLILTYTLLDIQSYPTESKSTWQFRKILSTNLTHEKRKRQGIETNDTLFNVTQHVLSFLETTKIRPPEIPLLRAYFIVVKEGSPDQSFGDVSEDIFIHIHKCHIVNEILTADIDWIDFEKVNLYIKEGKISKREVNVYCQTHVEQSSEMYYVFHVTQKKEISIAYYLEQMLQEIPNRQDDVHGVRTKRQA